MIGIDILSKFRRFQSLSRLKKLALTVIAQHLDDSEIESLKAVFTQLDTRGDGVLSIDEVREGIARSGVRLPSDMVLEEVLKEVDTAGTGCIDYTEFIAACLHQSHYIREEACRAAFRVLDINGDGHVRCVSFSLFFFGCMYTAGRPQRACVFLHALLVRAFLVLLLLRAYLVLLNNAFLFFFVRLSARRS